MVKKSIVRSQSIKKRILLRKAEGTSSLMRLIGESGEDELVLIKKFRKIRFVIPYSISILWKSKEDLQTTVP